jgi:hypothetical protein
LPSTLTQRCMRMVVTSLYVNAYFKRLRRIKQSGRHSRDLCGPARVVKKTRERTHRQSIVHPSSSSSSSSSRLQWRVASQSPSPRDDDHKALFSSPRASAIVVVVVVDRRRFATRTGGRLRREHTAELIEHPMLGRIESLKVFLEPSSHDRFLRGGELRGRACGARARSCASVRPSVFALARVLVYRMSEHFVFTTIHTHTQCLFF